MGNTESTKQPFKSRVTRDDVARRARVSTAVVSYVINNGPRPVAPETRERVERAIAELGYFPNTIARSLRSEQTHTLGLIIPRLTDPLCAEIASELQSICGQAGYLLPNSDVQVNLYNERPIGLELPPTVILTVTETEPGIKNATATNTFKAATMETGLVVQVPPFINQGEKIKVSTNDGSYMERA